MNRALQWINFAGIITLAVLCTLQWRQNRQLNLDVTALTQTRDWQAETIAERDKTIKGYVDDLEEMRERLKLAEKQLAELDDRLRMTVRDRDQLGMERNALIRVRDELKSSLEKWQGAVAERDAALAKAAAQIKSLVSDRNEAVGKFNDLAAKYNGLVKEFDNAKAAATRPTNSR